VSTDDEATRRRADLQPGAQDAFAPPPPAAPSAGAGHEQGWYAASPPPASSPPASPATAPAYQGAYGAGAPQYQQAYTPTTPYASWLQRVGALLIDSLLQLIGMLPYGIGIALLVAGSPTTDYDSSSGTSTTLDDGNTGLMVAGGVLIVVGFLVMFGINWWNRWLKMGRTGQSVGKKVMGITLVEERTGQPMGALMAFVRDLAHFLDGIFYIGYLWPLWDPKRQTFADKVCSTVVLQGNPDQVVPQR
jgi:uncharacterized RDD family membrane protein YckC